MTIHHVALLVLTQSLMFGKSFVVFIAYDKNEHFHFCGL